MIPPMRICLLAVALTLVSSLAVRLDAQVSCDAYPDNQIANCGFEAGQPPPDWTLVAGQALDRSTPARTGDFSGEILPEFGVIGFHALFKLESSCFARDGFGRYSVGSYVLYDSTIPSYCRANLNSYSDESCQVQLSSSESENTPLNPHTWTLVSASVQPSGSSLRLELFCYTDLRFGPNFLVDDAFAWREATVIEVPATSPFSLALLLVLLGISGPLMLRRLRGDH